MCFSHWQEAKWFLTEGSRQPRARLEPPKSKLHFAWHLAPSCATQHRLPHTLVWFVCNKLPTLGGIKQKPCHYAQGFHRSQRIMGAGPQLGGASGVPCAEPPAACPVRGLVRAS